MSRPPKDSPEELRDLFFQGAQELLQALNEAGLTLEVRPQDQGALRSVRRIVHTLKGDAAACGYRELSELAHELEDVLTEQVADSQGEALAELVLAAADAFHATLAAYRDNLKPPAPEALRQQIRRLTAAPTEAEPTRLEARFAWSEYEQLLIADAARQGATVFNIALALDPESAMRAAAWQLVRKVLAEVGTILAIAPDDSTPVKEVRLVEAALASTHPKDWIVKKCRIPAVVSSIWIETAATPEIPDAEARAHALPPRSAPPAPAQSRDVVRAAPTVGMDSTLRVETERIDSVMNLVGELIIVKSMLHRTMEEFDRRYAKDPLRSKFAQALALQSRALDELQKSVMKIRMVPVEQLFRRFPRVVRDVAKARQKDVALELLGQNTALDKTILDALAEPLAHLVRNAVDHGIEAPEERVAAGKPARGTLRLNAYHRGHHAVIEVEDDGRGIDREKVVRQAIRLGVLSADEATRLTDSEALSLILQPGLSTAEQVTEISGRGVGLDVVHSALEGLKGSLRVESQPGKGTKFVLLVPLTLASTKALLFYIAGRLYAVPLAAVVEITRLPESELHDVDGRAVVTLRNQVLPLARLDDTPAEKSARPGVLLVVITSGERKFGLVVDRLCGEEELVIKPLDDRLVSSELVGGASVLGDGTVVLVLNIAALLSRMSRVPALGAIA